MQLTSLSSNSYPADDGGGTWDYFPCPYCYVEIEVPVLSTHLLEEHCFDIKNSVCPLCAANPAKDMIEHMTVQHAYFLKRTKSRRANLWCGNPESVGKEPYGHNCFDRGPTEKRGSLSDSVSGPLLSSFVYNLSFTDSKNHREDNSDAAELDPSSLHEQSLDMSLSNQVLEKDYELRSQMAFFAQLMILSTIF
ncbi:uncharacterized protein A4U43_C05F5730 [Asparagus officinalis]|uniref:Drought induced 19 protein type zinc-binding domain-containing protein n=1 Tax=Asparagus officinalis TaxID=4686 RepID=A0A5P1ETC0_ASPOF|nr:protein DEHYDRATION-INDUCED 19 homolog 5-like isoform X2 [Asparagus officinalis]ONK67969.1 uncharacterized protein A4U43_C05F5730 [Asparagus officinalis]